MAMKGAAKEFPEAMAAMRERWIFQSQAAYRHGILASSPMRHSSVIVRMARPKAAAQDCHPQQLAAMNAREAATFEMV
jgi:hypothetical protein